MTYYITSPEAALEARRRMMRKLINNSMECEQVLNVPMDVKSNENEYVVEALLPGLTSEQVNIQFSNGALTIEGEYGEKVDDGYELHMSELPTGKFNRTLEFNDAINSEKIEVEMKNGILTIHLPKSEEAKPKTIKVVSKD